jgi:hypothetical protein
MSDGSSVNACPRCGSDWLAGGAFQSVRTCRDCGLRFRPPTPGWERTLIALVLIVPSLIGLVIAGFGVALAANAPAKDNGAVAAGLVCGAVFGVASIAGMYFGVREWRGRRQVATIVHDPVALGPGPGLTQERALEIAHAVAGEHRARHIIKQIGNIPPRRVARARARFAQKMTDDEVALLMVDTSFFRNGAAGLLITNRALYSTRHVTPIHLADMRQIEHRPPDKRTQMMLHLIVGLTHFFPPAAILMVLVMFGRRHRFRHVLAINDTVVHVAQKPMTWAFWVDLLVALSRELQPTDGRGRVDMLEICSSDPTVEPLRFHHPPDEAVERAIRSLDGANLCRVQVWAGTKDPPVGFEVLGGNGRYALRELPDGWVYYDGDAGEQEIEIAPGQRFPAYSVCADVERVLTIANEFVATGAFI